MSKRKIDLQMFAEPGGNEPPANDPPKDEPGGTEPPKDGKDEPEKKYTDEDVNKIVKERLAREKATHEKAVEEARKEAEKLAKMNADQKKQYEIEKQQEENKRLLEENEKLKAAAAKVELSKTAADILQKSGYDATPDVLALVVSDDAEKTKGNIDAFVKAVETQVKKAEQARATGTTPRSITNNQGEMSEIEKRIAKYE